MNLGVKEGNTPIQFLAAWSNGFSAVIMDKKDNRPKDKEAYLLLVCDDAINHLAHIVPRKMTQQEVIEGLRVFITLRNFLMETALFPEKSTR